MVATTNPRKLIDKLELAKKQLNNTKSREEQMAIYAYINLLDDSIKLVLHEELNNEKKDYTNDKRDKSFDKKFYAHETKIIQDFLLYRDFHRKFFESLQKKTEHELRKVDYIEYHHTTITEDEFYGIFFDFMNRIGLSKLFDKFVKNDRIYTTEGSIDNNTFAYTLFNAITKDSDMFVDGLEHDLFSMYNLAHEFGHIYDLNNFNEDIRNYNRYFYQSFNGEAISKTFERLFVDYLIEQNIFPDETKFMLYNMLYMNYDYALCAYIIPLLPDEKIINNLYTKLSPTKILKLVEHHFSRNDRVGDFVYNFSKLDIKETYTYAYGDVYSLFLKERIKEDNYSLDCLKEFFEFRSKAFKPEMLDKMNINPKEYVKLYKKDTDLLKKMSI